MSDVDVVVAGELYTDLIMSGFDFWPELGKEAFACEFHREIGGGAPITACGLARLGVRTRMAGKVGADCEGSWAIERLRNSGVDTSLLRVDRREASAITVVASTPQDRAFLTHPGANIHLPQVLFEAAKKRHFSPARHVHLAYTPNLATVAELFTAIRENGCTVSLDGGWHEAWLRDSRLIEALPLIDIVFPNEAEAQCITGEQDPERMLRKFSAAGARRVALKLGARGAALLWDGDILRVDGRSVMALDTTGAGDCFNAGFLYAWLNGESPQICLRSADFCGALSTESYGGINGFPSLERLQEELRR